MAGAPVAATLVHAIVLLGRDRSWVRIRPSNVDARIAKRLLQHGELFFALQLAAAFAYAPDNLIIAQTLGAASVTPYSVAAKLFSISLLLSDVALSPLWPAYGEAMARGDADWVRRTLARSLQLAAIASVALSTMLVLTGNAILTIWVGSDMQASTTLLLGLGLWTVLAALGTSVAMYLNASNLMWIQLVCSLLTVPTSILLKIAFVRQWGVSAVPWAMVVAYVLLTAVPLVVFSRRVAARGQRLVGNA
jgi:O-antigen/teichoic acid export membrane protein